MGITSREAMVLVRRALHDGVVLHARDRDGFALTIGRVAVPSGDDRWQINRWAPRAAGIQEDDCGSMAGVIRVFVRSYGPTVAGEAALRALGEER